LIDLALGDHRRRIGQNLEHPQTAVLHHQLERAAEQEIADQHAGGIAPDEIGGALAAAQIRAVDDIVVQQGRGMDELDRGGEQMVARAGIAEQPCAREREHRAHALAAARDEMAGERRDQRNFRLHARQNHGVDQIHVARRQLDHRFERRLALGIEAVDRGAHVPSDVAAGGGKGKPRGG